MPLFEDVLSQQPYPCFKLASVPEALKAQLKEGMLCLYNIDRHIFEFPTVGQFGHADRIALPGGASPKVLKRYTDCCKEAR